MISNIQKSIMIRALCIRKEAGEDPSEVLAGYKNLTEGEREEILKAIEQEGRSWNTYKRS